MAGGLLVVVALAAAPAPDAQLDRIEAEIAALRAEQARGAERLSALEAALAAARGNGTAEPAPVPAGGSAASAATALQAAPASPVNPAGASAPGPIPTTRPARLTLNGDMRLRFEQNGGDRDARDRGRAVLRARLRALYAPRDWLALGGQIATGDPDDPNSTDITLTGFNDDFDVSLDQAYVRLRSGKLTAFGGKIPLPFARTELVWDGDVSPQGISASYSQPLGNGSAVRATGLYFVVDESVAGPDSDMIGGQLAAEAAIFPALRLELAAGYYDYSLRSTAGGDSGDFRSNRFSDGRYLSDFNLLDGIVAVQYGGFGDAWPLRLVGNYVRNLGATVAADSGFGIDLLAGRIARRGDWRFGYGYAEVGIDAVLAAFSHDNTVLATNYLQHSLAIDYVPATNLILNVTYYRVRPKDALFSGTNLPGDWIDRLRLNLLVNF